MLAGCGWFGGSKDDTYVEQPVEVLYNRALDDLGAQNYKDAAKEFEEVDRQHPYSVWATKAQIMVAFTYYQSNKYDDAIIALDRFIQLHPGHRDIPYAYYLKGLCYYEQISDVGRDQRITQQALDALSDVAKRFPDSPYARDARIKVELCIDQLAGQEMYVGRYYQKQQQYVGAINRYRTVIERYQTTTPGARGAGAPGRVLPGAGRQAGGQGDRRRARPQLPGQRLVPGRLLPDDRRGHAAGRRKSRLVLRPLLIGRACWSRFRSATSS